MKPFYEDDFTTIYHGDAREVLPLLAFDAVVSDPPYGINVVRQRRLGNNSVATAREYHPVAGDEVPFDPGFLVDLGVPTILWGGNHFGNMPPASRWLVWDKREGYRSNNMADCELAWTSLTGPARLHGQRWMGMFTTTTHGDGERVHPTQKPVQLMAWCLSFVEGVVVDPYMGSGSTLVAAKESGRKAIGIELEERYCQIAAERMGQEVLDLGVAA